MKNKITIEYDETNVLLEDKLITRIKAIEKQLPEVVVKYPKL
jgi:hypothetical protein